MKQFFIFLSLAHEGGIVHSQAGRGGPHVSVFLVSQADVVVFELCHSQPQVQGPTIAISLMAACNGQVGGQDIVPTAEDDGLFHHVFQLPDITRPSVAVHYLHSRRGKSLLKTVFLVHIGQERLNQGLYVPLSLPQGWNLDGHRVKPIVEILPEGAFGDALLQVSVGGGDDPHVHVHLLEPAHGADPALLEDPEELGLEADVHFGDLVQEGNMGLMLAMEDHADDTEALLSMAKESMQALLESQEETKKQDNRMVEKVNDLDEQIKKLSDELGRKVSVDELEEFAGITEDEISNILKLAGEELPPEEK